MKAMKKISKKHIRYRGTSILETAFVLPILILFTLAIMGFGWLFLRVQQVTNAARHGARVAIRYGADEADVVEAVDGLLDPVNLTHDVPSVGPAMDPNIGEAVTVTVRGTGLDILNLNSLNMLHVPMLDEFTMSVTMAKEGP